MLIFLWDFITDTIAVMGVNIWLGLWNFTVILHDLPIYRLHKPTNNFKWDVGSPPALYSSSL